jgi:hypothetical protein
MSESDSTTVQTDNCETRYYEQLEKYINSLNQKFQEKCVIKQNVYNDIVKCFLLPKGKPSDFSPKFMYWVKRHFMLTKIADVYFACSIKSKKTICTYEDYYKIIGEAHRTVLHGGRIKTVHELNCHYSFIPRFAV